MSYEHCDIHDEDATNGCAKCIAEEEAREAKLAIARTLEALIADADTIRAAAESLNRRLGRETISPALVELVLYELRGRALGER